MRNFPPVYVVGYFLVALLLSSSAGAFDRIVWPTPNAAFSEGADLDAFVQPTASGRIESGLFGCVRNGGSRFHEGLDLYPILRDKRGEALDPVYSILPGRIAYINRTSGHSSYGRYVVVHHAESSPPVHTLYAHLASVEESLAVDQSVDAGATLGTMGRSATYSIPKSRAHLHFEIGFRLTDSFDEWYQDQGYKSRNRHGSWNGMNLVSVDPLAFFEAIRSGEVSTVYQYLEKIPVVARIRIYTTEIPFFVREHPRLAIRPYRDREVVGWDIGFTRYGVPKEWIPRFAGEIAEEAEGSIQVLAYDPDIFSGKRCRRLFSGSRISPQLSTGTIATIEKLFTP